MSQYPVQDCALQYNYPIQANPDIVGYGVLAAFVVTAGLTILAVCVSYITGSMDDSSLGDLDRAIIDWAADTKLMRAVFRTRKPPSSTEPTSRDTLKHREQLKEALERFILALSDQQLVTGLAILVAAMMNRATLTVYELQIILSLAWFSSTTHLVTMDALRPYLRCNPVVRHLRLAGIFAVASLLIFVFVSVALWGSVVDDSATVQCLFSHLQTKYLYKDDVVTIMAWFMALVIALAEYCTRIWGLYCDTSLETSILSRLIARAARGRPGLPYDGIPNDDAVSEARASVRQETLVLISKLPPPLRHIRAGAYLYRCSFISSMAGVAFSFSYGISQVIYYRFQYKIQLAPDANEFGFGQLMALFLLALPLLAVVELLCDSQGWLKLYSIPSGMNREPGVQLPPTLQRKPYDPEDQGPSACGPSRNVVEHHMVSFAAPIMADIATQYECQLLDIQRFFASDVRVVREVESLFGDPRWIRARKKWMISNYQTLRQTETSLRPVQGICYAIVSFSTFIGLGLSLNLISDPVAYYLLSALFLIVLGTKAILRLVTFVRSAYELYHIASDRTFYEQTFQKRPGCPPRRDERGFSRRRRTLPLTSDEEAQIGANPISDVGRGGLSESPEPTETRTPSSS